MFDHISSIKNFTILSVHFMTHFEIILIPFKAANGLAPPSLFELPHPYTPSHSLRSAAANDEVQTQR